MRKKLFILAAALLLAATSASAQFRWGASAGVVNSTLKFKQDLFAVDHAMGATAGIQGEMIFPGIGFGIDVGLNYTLRGARLHLGEKEIWASQGYGDPRLMLHDIDIPINLRLKWTRLQGLEDYVAPFVFGGPVFSICAGHGGVTTEADPKGALQFAGMDLGVQAGLGFEVLKRWQISGSYNWGMTYATKTRLLDDFSARSRTWTVRVTYFFK